MKTFNDTLRRIRAELTMESSRLSGLASSLGPTSIAEKVREAERHVDEARQILFDLQD